MSFSIEIRFKMLYVNELKRVENCAKLWVLCMEILNARVFEDWCSKEYAYQ